MIIESKEALTIATIGLILELVSEKEFGKRRTQNWKGKFVERRVE